MLRSEWVRDAEDVAELGSHLHSLEGLQAAAGDKSYTNWGQILYKHQMCEHNG